MSKKNKIDDRRKFIQKISAMAGLAATYGLIESASGNIETKGDPKYDGRGEGVYVIQVNVKNNVNYLVSVIVDFATLVSLGRS